MEQEHLLKQPDSAAKGFGRQVIPRAREITSRHLNLEHMAIPNTTKPLQVSSQLKTDLSVPCTIDKFVNNLFHSNPKLFMPTRQIKVVA